MRSNSTLRTKTTNVRQIFGCKRKSGSLFMIAHCRVEFSHRGIWFGLLESVDYQLSYNVQVGPI